MKPRRPFLYGTRTARPDATPVPTTIEELSRRVARIEPNGHGVPVLLRHYLRLGGRVLEFSIDDEFSNALDALMMLDLRRVEPALLARYMGDAGSAAFRAHHALD